MRQLKYELHENLSNTVKIAQNEKEKKNRILLSAID